MSLEPWLRGVLDAASMRAIDAWAIEERGVPSLELMEAAGAALAEAVRERAVSGRVRVVCGKGNNGGDGLVAARRLRETGFEAEPLLLWPAEELSEDAGENLRRLGDGAREIAAAEVGEALAGSGAVVDADATVTFHADKLGHWIAPGRRLRGELIVAPIGIPEGAPVELTAGLNSDAVLEQAPRRAP